MDPHSSILIIYFAVSTAFDRTNLERTVTTRRVHYISPSSDSIDCVRNLEANEKRISSNPLPCVSAHSHPSRNSSNVPCLYSPSTPAPYETPRRFPAVLIDRAYRLPRVTTNTPVLLMFVSRPHIVARVFPCVIVLSAHLCDTARVLVDFLAEVPLGLPVQRRMLKIRISLHTGVGK
jgi:hypothetical protein